MTELILLAGRVVTSDQFLQLPLAPDLGTVPVLSTGTSNTHWGLPGELYSSH